MIAICSPPNKYILKEFKIKYFTVNKLFFYIREISMASDAQFENEWIIGPSLYYISLKYYAFI